MADSPGCLQHLRLLFVQKNAALSTMQGQSDGRKQEVEAEAVWGGGGAAGGGNLTFTPQTNPPVTKTYFSALLDSLLWPPGPPKTCCLQFPYSCWKEKNGLGGVVRETPRGQRGHKSAVLLEGN